MQHIIFGAGMIGGYLGGALVNAGQSVGWVVRASTQQKLSKGLTLTDYQQQQIHCEQLQFVNPEQAITANILWLTVKCTSLTEAIKDMRHYVNDETIIICLQNGLGAEAIVQTAFPNNPVIRGVMDANITELSPGHLHRGTQGGISLPNMATTQALQTMITSPLLPVKLHDNLEGLLWAKLQLNLNNAINALSGIPLKTQLSQRVYRQVLASAMDELLSIARAKQLQLPTIGRIAPQWFPRILRLPDFLFKLVAKKMLAMDPKARSSMWDDLSNGRKTEIAFINTAIVNEGEALGIRCPTNLALSELIKSVENKQFILKPNDTGLIKRCLTTANQP